MADLVTLEDAPAPEVVEESTQPLLDEISQATPDFSAQIGTLTVHGYTATDLSPNDPYVLTETATETPVVVVVNMRHPHVGELKGADGVLNFLRHCAYDALAEWKARRATATPDPDTIKLFKDSFLRVSMKIEMHRPD